MAEEMEVQFDVQTATAMEKIQALTGAMVELKDAALAAGEAVDGASGTQAELAANAEKATTQVKGVGGASSAAAGKIEKMGEATGNTTSQLKDMDESGGKLNKTLGMLSGTSIAFILGFAGIEAVTKALGEAADNAERLAKARETLTGERLDLDRKLNRLTVNLGFGPDPTGQDRALNLSQAFQAKATATPEQAIEILDAANAAGLNPKDPKSKGFLEALEAGKFGSRTGLSAETSGQLMHFMANAPGVKDAASARDFLASLESKFQNVQISSPDQFYEHLFKATAERLQQKVPFDQAIAQYASAAATTSDASQAANSTDIFRRVASGGSRGGQYLTALSELALNRGLISQKALDTAANSPDVIGRVAKDSQLDELDKLQRDIGEKSQSLPQYESDLKKEADLGRRGASRVRGGGRERAMFEANKRASEVDDKIQKRRQEITDMQTHARQIRDRIGDDARKQALTDLYEGLPLAQKEQLLYDATAGMTAEQRDVFLSHIAPGREKDMVSLQLSPAGRAARDRAMGKMTRGDRAAFDAREKQFASSNIAQSLQAEIDADKKRMAAIQSGESYANDIFKAEGLAKKEGLDLEQHEKGRGGFGFFRTIGSPDAAEDEEGALAIQGTQILVDRAQAFWQSMSAAQRARHPELGQWLAKNFGNPDTDFRRGLKATARDIFSGPKAKNMAFDLAKEFGAMRQNIQKDAIRKGEPLPRGDEPAGQPLGPPGPQSRRSFGGGADLGAPGPAAPNGAAIGSRAAVHYHGPIYNITNGNVWTGGGSEFDEPGRLEGLG